MYAGLRRRVRVLAAAPSALGVHRYLSTSLTFCTAIFANISNLLHSREEVQADFSAWASGG
jgi:hypothetical protein